MPKTEGAKKDGKKVSGVQVYMWWKQHGVDWRAKYKVLSDDRKAFFSGIAKQMNSGKLLQPKIPGKPGPKPGAKAALKKAEKDVSLDGLLGTAVKKRAVAKRGPLKHRAYGMYSKAVREKLQGQEITVAQIREQWDAESEEVKAKFQRRADRANAELEKKQKTKENEPAVEPPEQDKPSAEPEKE